MSNTWDEIQSVRSKTAGWRDKLARRKQERQNILDTSRNLINTSSVTEPAPKSAEPVSNSTENATDILSESKDAVSFLTGDKKNDADSTLNADDMKMVENCLLLELDAADITLPLDAVTLSEGVLRETKIVHNLSTVTDILLRFESQYLVVTEEKLDEGMKVLSTNSQQIEKVLEERKLSRKRTLTETSNTDTDAGEKNRKIAKPDALNIEMLLASETAKERESKKMNEEIQDLLSTASAKEQMMSTKFKSQGGTMKEFCSYGTRVECKAVNGSACDKVHFRKLMHQHTDPSLGDCSFLNTCFHMDTCKYVHYEVDQDDLNRIKRANMSAAVRSLTKGDKSNFKMMPSQWIQCDLRNFDMTVLGKFAVIMADPPWDIHMELPYGTMSDEEMRSLNIPTLQDDGYIFLWVTGRAMELGRQCLELWGYRRCDELIWVKTNQLQKLIRTGRTGHWINHGKEHCLIGVKGNPENMNRGLDCDVIVAEVRATSHKPDEVYGLIERLSPGTRKIELFGRPHNVQPNWMTLGNQCDGVQLHEDDVKRSFKQKYPDGKCV
ncbi:N6-adenosine-methyltransferase subunit METTL3-like [Watersipora subatra]|uniref:N6-adenosine-methyltransferase subunit METTL3-like n=1 Tax=Watersipora subatra TaxID=2589382 RepID=UPI00355C729B